MAKLIYSMPVSLDGYTEDEHGGFGWAAPEEEELHSYINELASTFGTYLYGRRMYETMVYWETAHTVRDQPRFVLDFARQWQAAEKIVYSRTLAAPHSARTTIEREFDPEAVRRLKAEAEHDIAVDGPQLAAQAIKAGLVNEFQMIVCPVVVGGGRRFFPDVHLEFRDPGTRLLHSVYPSCDTVSIDKTADERGGAQIVSPSTTEHVHACRQDGFHRFCAVAELERATIEI